MTAVSKIEYFLYNNNKANNKPSIFYGRVSLRSDYGNLRVGRSTNFQDALALSKDELEDLIGTVFSRENRLKITEQTGFNFSIDFFVANRNKHINENQRSVGRYSNLWHRDLKFTENTFKVFLLLEDVDLDAGPLEYLDYDLSKKNSDLDVIRITNLPNEIANKAHKFIGTKGSIIGFNPNIFVHRAGVPNFNRCRLQCMFQLNPSKEWSYKSNLDMIQLNYEPNFPQFRNILYSNYKKFNT